jgi:hypothetical protein
MIEMISENRVMSQFEIKMKHGDTGSQRRKGR